MAPLTPWLNVNCKRADGELINEDCGAFSNDHISESKVYRLLSLRHVGTFR